MRRTWIRPKGRRRKTVNLTVFENAKRSVFGVTIPTVDGQKLVLPIAPNEAVQTSTCRINQVQDDNRIRNGIRQRIEITIMRQDPDGRVPRDYQFLSRRRLPKRCLGSGFRRAGCRFFEILPIKLRTSPARDRKPELPDSQLERKVALFAGMMPRLPASANRCESRPTPPTEIKPKACARGEKTRARNYASKRPADVPAASSRFRDNLTPPAERTHVTCRHPSHR